MQITKQDAIDFYAAPDNWFSYNPTSEQAMLDYLTIDDSSVVIPESSILPVIKAIDGKVRRGRYFRRIMEKVLWTDVNILDACINEFLSPKSKWDKEAMDIKHLFFLAESIANVECKSNCLYFAIKEFRPLGDYLPGVLIDSCIDITPFVDSKIAFRDGNGEYVYNSLAVMDRMSTKIFSWFVTEPEKGYKVLQELYDNNMINKGILVRMINDMPTLEDAYGYMDTFDASMEAAMAHTVVLPSGIMDDDDYDFYKNLLNPEYIGKNLTKEFMEKNIDTIPEEVAVLSGKFTLRELQDFNKYNLLRYMPTMTATQAFTQSEIAENLNLFTPNIVKQNYVFVSRDNWDAINKQHRTTHPYYTAEQYNQLLEVVMMKLGFNTVILEELLDELPISIPDVVATFRRTGHNVNDEELKKKIYTIVKLYS